MGNKKSKSVVYIKTDNLIETDTKIEDLLNKIKFPFLRYRIEDYVSNHYNSTYINLEEFQTMIPKDNILIEIAFLMSTNDKFYSNSKSNLNDLVDYNESAIFSLINDTEIITNTNLKYKKTWETEKEPNIFRYIYYEIELLLDDNKITEYLTNRKISSTEENIVIGKLLNNKFYTIYKSVLKEIYSSKFGLNENSISYLENSIDSQYIYNILYIYTEYIRDTMLISGLLNLLNDPIETILDYQFDQNSFGDEITKLNIKPITIKILKDTNLSTISGLKFNQTNSFKFLLKIKKHLCDEYQKNNISTKNTT
jgi:hypothetical protein